MEAITTYFTVEQMGQLLTVMVDCLFETAEKRNELTRMLLE